MFKVNSYALAAALLVHSRGATACDPAENGGVLSKFTGVCNWDNFIGGVVDGCADFVADYTAQHDDAKEFVEELCAYDAPVQFVEIQGTYQKDRRYFAGGGNLVDGAEWSVDAAQIQRFERNLASGAVISFPEYEARFEYNNNTGRGENGYPANMNLETSCDLNTVMCCFTDDTKYDSFDANGDATTDVCRHDHHDSPESNHIRRGWSVLSGEETSTHCVGFTWKDEEEDLLGNMMYDVSLRNSINKGYLKGIPGAPLCGCVEHMPVVEKAACRTASVAGDVTFEFRLDAETDYLSASNRATIEYGDCDEADLAKQYKANGGDGAIEAHLVGDGGCAADVEDYLNDEEFLRDAGDLSGSRYETPDPAQWSDLFIGKGVHFLPPGIDLDDTDAEFRDLVEGGCKDEGGADRPCMIRRVCPSCSAVSHRDVVYKRLTGLPPPGNNATLGEANFLYMFMDRWSDFPKNQMGVDFELYSTYEDAVSGTNPWEFCDYGDNVGFPRNCGPSGGVHHNWNSYMKGHHSHAGHHGFYVEKA